MSDTPKTDAACGWPWGHHGRIESSDLRWSPDGPFVHSSVARELERENAALRAQDAWLVATFGNREDENQKLRVELEAQAVVNGKGGEREAKLLSIISRIRWVIDRELDWSQAQRLEKAGDLCDEVLGKEAQP